MSKASEIKRGLAIVFKNEPHLVVDFQHVNPGKGSAFVRTRLKSLRTGKVLENTFKADESVEFVELERVKVQYLYGANNEYSFMNMQTYEQFTVRADVLANCIPYLKEGLEVVLLISKGAPVTVDFPKKVNLKVTEAPPGVRGDTATNVTKEIILENGLRIRTPLFIKEGDMVVVNTDNGEYVERVQE